MIAGVFLAHANLPHPAKAYHWHSCLELLELILLTAVWTHRNQTEIPLPAPGEGNPVPPTAPTDGRATSPAPSCPLSSALPAMMAAPDQFLQLSVLLQDNNLTCFLSRKPSFHMFHTQNLSFSRGQNCVLQNYFFSSKVKPNWCIRQWMGSHQDFSGLGAKAYEKKISTCLC